MKLTAFFLVIGCLHVSAKSIGQMLTLSEKNSPIEKVFRLIEKQTDYSFTYAESQLSKARPITIEVRNGTLEQVLNICFKNQPFSYAIIDKAIVVKPKPEVSDNQSRPVLMPPIDVKGKLTNENGEPVIASVVVKGTNQGTTTNANGEFSLSNVDENATLVFTATNIEAVEIKLNGRTQLAVTARMRITRLDEIQVIAYGQSTQRLNTGNVSTVKASDIEKQPVSNVLQALQGQVPGLIVTQSNGFSSAPFTVKIRGQNSLATNVSDGINSLSEPLYIIDGVPIISAGNSSNLNVGTNKNGFSGPALGQSPLYAINPSDIESISILKDADATAIYGARGANGVVLITTKKGRAGKANVTANVYTGVSLQTKKLNLMNTAEYLEMRTRAHINDNITPTAGNAYDLKLWDQNRYTDWQKEFLATAHTTDVQLSLSGGDNQTTYRVGAGFNRSSPPFKGDYKEERASGSLALTNIAFDNKLTTAVSLNFSSTTSNLPPADLTRLIFLAPNAPSLLDSAGNLNYAGWPAFTFPTDATSLKRLYSAATKNLIGNLTLKYAIMRGLDFNASLGYNISRQNQIQIAPFGSFDPTSTTLPFSVFGNNDSRAWVIEPTLTYRKNFAKHNITTLIGSTFQDTKLEGNRINANGYTNNAFLTSLAAAASYASPFTNYAQTKFQSVYARITYNYNDKYVLNLNGRRDGSSRFATDNRFGNFGSVGAAWIFTREQFMQKASSFLSFGKIRASYGLVGGDNLNDYQYLSSFVPGQYPYQGTSSFQLGRLANDQFGWTTNKKLEAGLLLGFLQDRITTEFSWYRNRSGNQLVSYPLPAITGFTSVVENLPAEVENKGWELALQSQNVRTRNFSWNTSFNISRNRNKLLEFPGLATSAYANRYAIGRSINSTGLYKFTGVDPTTKLYTFADVDGNGTVDLFGRSDHIYKDNAPAYFGGFTNNISYKDLQLSFLFSFTKQMGILRLSNVAAGALGSGLGNQLVASDQIPGKPALEDYTTNGNRTDRFAYYSSDAVFVDASYIRLQNISLAYNLSTKLLRKAKMQSLRIYLHCQNLLTITDYKGTDPESPGSFSLPPRKMVTGGIQLTL